MARRNLSRLSVQILQPTLNQTGVIVTLFCLVLFQHNSPHQTTRRTTTSKEFKLGEALFGEDIETIESYPASMGKGSHLFDNWSVEGFIGQLFIQKWVSTVLYFSNSKGEGVVDIPQRQHHPSDSQATAKESQNMAAVVPRYYAPEYKKLQQ